MMRTMVMLVSSLVLSAGVLIGCGGGTEKSSAPANAPNTPMQTPATATSTPVKPAGPEIVISGFQYAVPASVKPGETVTIVNNDEMSHTVTADDINLFDVRVSGGGGISTLTAPSTPGTYPIHCKYHSNMHGTLTVQ